MAKSRNALSLIHHAPEITDQFLRGHVSVRTLEIPERYLIFQTRHRIPDVDELARTLNRDDDCSRWPLCHSNETDRVALGLACLSPFEDIHADQLVYRGPQFGRRGRANHS
jgi:hypothetical protein